MIKSISRLCSEDPKGKIYKYEVDYCSGATGFGWEDKCDTIEEVNIIISDICKIHNARVSVYDNNLSDFIFYKHTLSQPSIDMIHNYKRDLRTKTRERNF